MLARCGAELKRVCEAVAASAAYATFSPILFQQHRSARPVEWKSLPGPAMAWECFAAYVLRSLRDTRARSPWALRVALRSASTCWDRAALLRLTGAADAVWPTPTTGRQEAVIATRAIRMRRAEARGAGRFTVTSSTSVCGATSLRILTHPRYVG